MIQGFDPRLWYQTKEKNLVYDPISVYQHWFQYLTQYCHQHFFISLDPIFDSLLDKQYKNFLKNTIRKFFDSQFWKLRNHKIEILFIIKNQYWKAVGEIVEISAQNYQHKIINTKSNSKKSAENCAQTPNSITIDSDILENVAKQDTFQEYNHWVFFN